MIIAVISRMQRDFAQSGSLWRRLRQPGRFTWRSIRSHGVLFRIRLDSVAMRASHESVARELQPRW